MSMPLICGQASKQKLAVTTHQIIQLKCPKWNLVGDEGHIYQTPI